MRGSIRGRFTALEVLTVQEGLEGALQVLLQAGRRLEGDLEALLQQDGGEVGVALGRQPQAEGRVRRHARELLLELRHPVHDQVQVLEAEPVARFGRLVQHADRVHLPGDVARSHREM